MHVHQNRPFAQLLPGLETGHPVTRSVSHLHMISVFPTGRKLFFLSPFRTVLSAIQVQVTDRPSPDAPSLTQAIIVQMVYSKQHLSIVPSFRCTTRMLHLCHMGCFGQIGQAAMIFYTKENEKENHKCFTDNSPIIRIIGKHFSPF